MDQRSELIERGRHGDREAFEALARAASGRLYGVAYRILRNADLADDALQETLLAIWQELPTLRDSEHYDGWTYRITCRVCHRLARRERSHPVVRLLEPMLGSARAGVIPGVDRDVADRDEMERAFARLPVDQRTVLVLHHYLGLSLGEIADTLGIPPGTVGSRLYYAMRSLRAAIESDARVTAAWERPS